VLTVPEEPPYLAAVSLGSVKRSDHDDSIGGTSYQNMMMGGTDADTSDLYNSPMIPLVSSILTPAAANPNSTSNNNHHHQLIQHRNSNNSNTVDVWTSNPLMQASPIGSINNNNGSQVEVKSPNSLKFGFLNSPSNNLSSATAQAPSSSLTMPLLPKTSSSNLNSVSNVETDV
jgi:hypothetical protein